MGQPIEMNFVIKLRKEEEAQQDRLSAIIKSGYRVFLMTTPLDYCDSQFNVLGRVKVTSVSVKYLNDVTEEDLAGTIFLTLSAFKEWYLSRYTDDLVTIVKFEILERGITAQEIINRNCTVRQPSLAYRTML